MSAFSDGYLCFFKNSDSDDFFIHVENPLYQQFVVGFAPKRLCKQTHMVSSTSTIFCGVMFSSLPLSPSLTSLHHQV